MSRFAALDDALHPDPSRDPCRFRSDPHRELNRTLDKSLDRLAKERFPGERAQYRYRHEIMSLRGNQLQILVDVARFKTIDCRDLRYFIYGGDVPGKDAAFQSWKRFWADVRNMQRYGLVKTQTVPASKKAHFWQRPQKPVRVITITKKGMDFVSREFGREPEKPHRMSAKTVEVNGQKLYSGNDSSAYWEHDSRLYACTKDAIERQKESSPKEGLEVTNIKLGRQIKEESKAIQRQIDSESGSSGNVPIQVPDVRVEMQYPSGERVTLEIEYCTDRYSTGKIESKAKAGYRLYCSSSDYSRVRRAVDRKSPLTDVFTV